MNLWRLWLRIWWELVARLRRSYDDRSWYTLTHEKGEYNACKKYYPVNSIKVRKDVPAFLKLLWLWRWCVHLRNVHWLLMLWCVIIPRLFFFIFFFFPKRNFLFLILDKGKRIVDRNWQIRFHVGLMCVVFKPLLLRLRLRHLQQIL